MIGCVSRINEAIGINEYDIGAMCMKFDDNAGVTSPFGSKYDDLASFRTVTAAKKRDYFDGITRTDYLYPPLHFWDGVCCYYGSPYFMPFGNMKYLCGVKLTPKSTAPYWQIESNGMVCDIFGLIWSNNCKFVCALNYNTTSKIQGIWYDSFDSYISRSTMTANIPYGPDPAHRDYTRSLSNVATLKSTSDYPMYFTQQALIACENCVIGNILFTGHEPNDYKEPTMAGQGFHPIAKKGDITYYFATNKGAASEIVRFGCMFHPIDETKTVSLHLISLANSVATSDYRNA